MARAYSNHGTRERKPKHGQKADRVRKELALDPSRSNRQIAEKVGCSREYVSDIRVYENWGYGDGNGIRMGHIKEAFRGKGKVTLLRWLYTQVPDGMTLMEYLVAIAQDAYNEAHDEDHSKP